MKNKIWTWIVDTLKDFRKALIAFFVASGIGALIFASIVKFGSRAYDLISNHLIELGILLLFVLFYLLGRRNEKNKSKATNSVSIAHHDLIQYGPLKWDVKIYTNDHFEVFQIPYCARHDMRLVEQWPLYFCPKYEECNSQISYRDIPIAKGQMESHIESVLRKQKMK